MTAFTIFKNTNTGAYASVYDFQLPTQTGIGRKEEWQPVYHGQATGLLDRVKQRKEYVERMKSNERKNC